MHEDCETKSIIDEPGFKVSEEKTPFILSYREARSSFTWSIRFHSPPPSTATTLFNRQKISHTSTQSFPHKRLTNNWQVPDKQTTSHNSPKPTPSTTNSADITDLAYRSAVLSKVLRAIEGTRHSGFAAGVNGRVAGAADGELGESVELDVDGVCGLALGDGFEFAGLW
jgi:hypothetical protein